MKSKNKILATLLMAGLSSLALSTGALAQTAPDFKTVDADNSGSLNFGEAAVVYGGLTQAQFETADVDKNGSLNETEYNSLATAGVSMTAAATGDGAAMAPMTPPEFKDVDADNSGSLSFGEAAVVYGGLTQAQFETADVDKNGSLNETEYNSLATAGVSMTAAAAAGDAMAAPSGPMNFKDVDANSDGSLNFAEAGVAHAGLTQEQFTAADVDGNGSLNEGEYASLGM